MVLTTAVRFSPECFNFLKNIGPNIFGGDIYLQSEGSKQTVLYMQYIFIAPTNQNANGVVTFPMDL